MEASVDPLCPLRIPGCRFVNSNLFFFLVRDPRSEVKNILQEQKCPCPPEPFLRGMMERADLENRVGVSPVRDLPYSDILVVRSMKNMSKG